MHDSENVCMCQYVYDSFNNELMIHKKKKKGIKKKFFFFILSHIILIDLSL